MYNSGSGNYSGPNGRQTSHSQWSADGNRPPGYFHPRDQQQSQLNHPSTQHISAIGPAHRHPPGHIPPHSQPLTPPSSHNTGVSSDNSKRIGLSDKDGIREPPTKFAELESMSLADLRSLNSDQTRFNDFVSNNDYHKSLTAVIAKLQLDLDELEKNYASSSRTGNNISEADIEEMQRKNETLEEEVAALRKEQTDWMEQNSPERLIERLRVAMKESADASEYLERSFMSKTLNVDEFLEQYVECRKTYHERSQKLEQLKQEVKRKTYGR